MLIMWRRSGQSVAVGDGVEITILEARPNRVRLGIVAPDSVAILRKETQATREQNLAAALGADHTLVDTLLQRLQRNAAPSPDASEIDGVK